MVSTVEKEESQSRISVRISCRQPFAAMLMFILAYGLFEATRQNEYTVALQTSMRGLSFVAIYLGAYLLMRIRRFELDLDSRDISFYSVKLYGLRRLKIPVSQVEYIKLHSRRVINGRHFGFMSISHICAMVVEGKTYDFYFSGKIRETLNFGSRVAHELNCKLIDEMEKNEGTVGTDAGMHHG